MFFRQIQINNNKCRSFASVKNVSVVRNNKPVTDAISKSNEHRKPFSISNFNFSTLYINLLHNKLLMVLNNLIDFYFDGEDKYITVSGNGASGVTNIKNLNVLRNST